MDPSKRPTTRMKRVHIEQEHVVKIQPMSKKQARGPVREEVVIDDDDPRRERG